MELDLRSFTPARVAIGRTGNSLPTAELLRFELDHARARDAVYRELAPGWPPLPHIALQSAAPDRSTYLRRPDLGRRLSEESKTRLSHGDYDTAIIIADGLSALAVERHALPLLEQLQALLPREDWRLAPLTVVAQGRVAVGDEIGERLGARSVVVLIGERPGLTSPDSLGVYFTWNPRPGRTDAQRNCVSNIRAEGLGYGPAARLIHLLLNEARRQKLSGVQLRVGRSAENQQIG
jgi:ethanolamine ammonia-lyase small subunit